MEVHVKKPLKCDLAAAFKLCTDQKSLESTYDQLGGEDIRIKREGRAPNLKIAVQRRMPANPPAAIRMLVPSMNDVQHTEKWRSEDGRYEADIVVNIKGVPVDIAGTKALYAEKGGSVVEWRFDVTSKVMFVGSILAAFGGEQLKGNLEDEYAVLKKSV